MSTDSGPTDAAASERTLGQLVADATSDVSEIIHAEIALAKAELAIGAKNGALAGGLFGAAGYLVLLATILLSIAAGYGLVATGLHPGFAFLILGGVYLLIAALLAVFGRSRVARLGPPQRAIRSTREAIAAVKPGPRGR